MGELSEAQVCQVWSTVIAHVDDCRSIEDTVVWMPAHAAESRVAHAKCSNGQVISSSMWASNQLVDLMAKDAACSIRLPLSFRAKFVATEKHLKEFFMFLGQLTHAANSFVGANGGVLRDSEAAAVRVKDRRGRRSRHPTVSRDKSTVPMPSSAATPVRAPL